MSKSGSFTVWTGMFLLLKILFDCVARIAFFGMWLYVQNEGQFSSTKTVIAFYSTAIVLFLSNSFFNKKKEKMTRQNITGKIIFTNRECLRSLA